MRFHQFGQGIDSTLSWFPTPLIEVMPAEDGAVSFRFRMAEKYERPNGDDVRIEAGQQWYVGAYQNTESDGFHGSHGAIIGPLTVK